MSAHCAVFRIAAMARVLGVSRSGYYARRQRTQTGRERDDEALSSRIQRIHRASRQSYGSPRIHAALRARGTRVGRKRVARLMREAGLVGVSRQKRHCTTIRHP